MSAVAEQLDLLSRTVGTRRAEVARLIARAVPVAQALATRAGWQGITAENLWRGLRDAQVITGAETGRSLSWFRHVFPAAGLVNTHRRRRNGRNRNDNDVYVTCHFAATIPPPE